MERCKRCRIPLSGFLGKVADFIAGIRRSEKFPGFCNKCEPKEAPGKYFCQICAREIDESAALMHVKTEEYLLELIRRDHPEWKEDKNTCPKCIDYYRELITKAEI
jgi:hypothetical protein